MSNIIKPLGPSVTITTTPDSVGDATLVRLYSTDVIVVTLTGENPSVFNMNAGEVMLLEKPATDTIVTDGLAVRAMPIAYRN